MRTLGLLGCLAACGRIGFDANATDGGDGVRTGPLGPRWIRQLGDETIRIAIAGTAGELVGLQRFSASFAGDGVALTGQAATSSALVRYAPDGALDRTRVFDSEGSCEMRSLIVGSDTMIVAGFTSGSQTMASRGACSIVTSNRQDPIVIAVDNAGAETVIAHWSASVENAQIWGGAQYASGQLVYSGVYSGDLTIGSPLPTAMVDPNAWLAAPSDGTPTNARWAVPMSANVEVHSGPVAAYGTSAFMVGSFTSSATLIGVPVTSLGSYDTWLARINEDGSLGFFRTIGSTQPEPSFGNNTSLVALPDGGCVIALQTAGDVTFDSRTFLASDGIALVLRLDANGNLVSGMRVRDIPQLAFLGDKLYAGFRVTTEITIGGTNYVPDMGDVVIVELGPDAPIRLVSVIAGAGSQAISNLAVVGPDALGFSVVSSGELTFGATTMNTGGSLVRFVGVLGL